MSKTSPGWETIANTSTYTTRRREVAGSICGKRYRDKATREKKKRSIGIEALRYCESDRNWGKKKTEA